jgi:predicted nucleotidyltransferase component of viral defense system
MLKLATQEQINFYEKILYPMQDEIFSMMESDKFYLTGGTCLSRFYYHHRYSDDLDFFFLGNMFPKQDFEAEFNEIQKIISKEFKTQLEISSDYFKRLFVYKNDTALKIEFVYENFQTVKNPISKGKIFLDTKENILANKFSAIHGRKTVKDYFDLLFLLKEFSISQGIESSQLKQAPLNYEGAVLSLIGGNLEGIVYMIKEISESDFQTIRENLIKELLTYAKTIP